MNRKEAKDLLPIIRAFVEGKTIQEKASINEWRDLYNNIAFDKYSPQGLRIKPSPKYRPFKDAEECWDEMKKHEPFGWIRDHNDPKFKQYVLSVDNDGVMIADYDDGAICQDFEILFKFTTFVDGTPFGIKEN